jgi:hypothetical protein
MTDDLPKAISTAVIDIGPLQLTVHNLDNGQRVVDAESMERFMHFLATGEALPPMKDVTPGETA